MSIKQFRRFPADSSVYHSGCYYEYNELISKNNQHLFKDIHAKNKSIKVHAMCDSEKCLVRILDFYFSKLPVETQKHFTSDLWQAFLKLLVNLGLLMSLSVSIYFE